MWRVITRSGVSYLMRDNVCLLNFMYLSLGEMLGRTPPVRGTFCMSRDLFIYLKLFNGNEQEIKKWLIKWPDKGTGSNIVPWFQK